MSADIHALSGAYALDAVDDQERADFERHLAECTSCQLEVDSLREAAAQLAATSATVPPETLREQVLAGARQIRPLPPRVPVLVPTRRRLTVLGAAAALVLGTVVWHPWQDSTPVAATAVSRIEHASDAVATEQSLARGGSVTWYRSASLGRAAVIAHDLPTLGAAKVYQLWLQDSAGRFIPAGFVGSGTNATVLAGSAVTAQGAGITVEPAGGSAQPTSAPLALVAFGSA